MKYGNLLFNTLERSQTTLKYKQLNGITAEEYLKKARVLFEEMDLKWNLEQLEKVENEAGKDQK